MSTGSAGSLQDPDSMEFDSDTGEENGEGSGEYERRNSVVEVSNTDVDEEEISFALIQPVNTT